MTIAWPLTNRVNAALPDIEPLSLAQRYEDSELLYAAAAVIDSWEDGDLALRVNELREAVEYLIDGRAASGI